MSERSCVGLRCSGSVRCCDSWSSSLSLSVSLTFCLIDMCSVSVMLIESVSWSGSVSGNVSVSLSESLCGS